MIYWPGNEWWFWACAVASVLFLTVHQSRRRRDKPCGLLRLLGVACGTCLLYLAIGLCPTLLVAALEGTDDLLGLVVGLLFWTLGAHLLSAGWAIGCWAVLVDRNGRRRMCPGCRYDMTGVPGLRCPECGRAARSERTLMRAPRKKRWILAAMLVLLAGGVGASLPWVLGGGFYERLPLNVLLAAAPWLPGTDGEYELGERLRPYSRWERPRIKLSSLNRTFLARSCRTLMANSTDATAVEYAHELLSPLPPMEEMAAPIVEAARANTWGRPDWIEMLGRFSARRPVVEPAIISYLSDPSQDTASAAERALLALWSYDADDHDAAGSPPLPPEWLIARSLLGSEKTRLAALQALATYLPAATASEAAATALHDPSDVVRGASLHLRLHADPHGRGSIMMLIETLDDRSPLASHAALSEVWNNEGLLDDPEVRDATARALLRLQPEEPKDALEQLTHVGTHRQWRLDVLLKALDNPFLRESALLRLTEIASHARPALARLREMEAQNRDRDAALSRRAGALASLIQRMAPPEVPPHE